MPKQRGDLDRAYGALSDPTRRAVVERLIRGPASVSQLAQPLDMAMPSVMQHLGVLQAGGLVTSEKHGRVRTYRAHPAALRAAERWIAEQRADWERRLDRLDAETSDPHATKADMTPTVLHTTFTLERTYAAEPARIFRAWADPEAKARWFAADGEHELDFRVGGKEVTRNRLSDGTRLVFASRYEDIVDDQRIVYASTLHGDDALATVSLTTVQLELFADGGTRLTLTEQDTHLDSREDPEWRRRGTAAWLEDLGAELEAGIA